MATIQTGGQATGLTPGNVTIRAELSRISGDALLAVLGRPLKVTLDLDSVECIADCDGVFMGRYEIQVLDSYDNRTYTDGMAASIYGEWPPRVNAARKPGEWQSYDIIFEAPRFGGRPSPSYFTVIWNGVLVHNRQELAGTTTAIMTPHQYTAHEAELPLQLQQHGNRVHFRNIWIRRLRGYDESAPAKAN